MMEKKFDVSEEDIDRLMGVFVNLSNEQVWSKVKRTDFTVRRFEMGYVNDISCCEMTTEARNRLCTKPTDIPAIVVKFKPKESFFNINRLEFTASNAIMSELKITPKLIYIDDDCMINEYIDGRNYKYEDDIEPKMVRQVARALARIHSARPPISINTFKTWEKLFGPEADFDKSPALKPIIDKQYMEFLEKESDEIKEKYWTLFSEIDFNSTNEYTRQLIKKVNSPLVFSHVDFNRGNRLVKETPNDDGTVNKELWVIDFDYSTFNYRGLDLGRYFSNYRHVDDMFGDEGFPSDEEMKLFLNEYREECARIQGDFYLEDSCNSLEQLIRETKVFTLNAYGDYFFCLMMYNNDPTGPRKNYFMQSAFNRYSAYKKQKQRFIEDGTIPYILGE